MKVWILNLECPSEIMSTDVFELSYEKTTGAFSMPRPIGDDWLQRIVHIHKPFPELFHKSQQKAVVIFESREVASNFFIWLKDANEEAEHGFRTMRG